MYNGIILGLIILFVLILLGLVVTLLIHAFSAPVIMTPHNIAEEIAKEIQLKDNEKFLELGAGTGNVSFQIAKKRQVEAILYEIAPIPIIVARLKQIYYAITRKLKGKILFEVESMYTAKIQDISAIYVYLDEKAIDKISRPLVQWINDGVTVYSYKHEIPKIKAAVIELSNGEKLYKYAKK